jgi:hypothetical protein
MASVRESLKKKAKRRVRVGSASNLPLPKEDAPMRIGTARAVLTGCQEKNLHEIKEENISEANLSSGGYQTVLFNMMWLVSTRVVKMLRDEPMDEELFRNYFVRIYRKIVQMETNFWRVLDDESKQSFVVFSKSLGELASIFKV